MQTQILTRLKITLQIIFLVTATALACVFPVAAQDITSQPQSDKLRCENLTGGRFTALPEAPTWIVKATFRVATAERRAHCEIDGYVNPTINFGMFMPAENWNGKTIFRGCGGSCGRVYLEGACGKHLRDGYACITTDMGHRSDQIDNNWVANNLQGVVDFGYRATHVTAVAGKAIVAAFYERPPKLAYFYGCSTGGRQAMIEAQRFPNDFNGIVAVAPASMGPFGSRRDSNDGLENINRAANGSVILPDIKVPAIYKAVIAQCDLNDGVKDGIIDPRECNFDPAMLLCKARETNECLTAPQVDVARKFYAAGVRVGSELNWINNLTAAPKPGVAKQFAQSRGELGIIETLDNPANPDLHPFKARGGRLILAHGSTDLIVPAGPSQDYYELATATMGGAAATQEFFRFFIINGMDHCSGGDGAWGIDYIAAIDNWVERGIAPDKLVGVRPKLGVALDYFGIDSRLLKPEQIEFSRPYFPHPTKAYYTGIGDAADANNFVAGGVASAVAGSKPSAAQTAKAAQKATNAAATPTTETPAQLADRVLNLIAISEDAYAKGVQLPPKNVTDRIGKAVRRLIYSSGASNATIAAALVITSKAKLSDVAQAAMALIQAEYAGP